VVGPDGEGVAGDQEGGTHHRPVAEQRLAREDRSHLADDPEHGQDDDVALGVAEEPEAVQVQHRGAALVGVEEAGAELAVEKQPRQRRGQRRKASKISS
jgi:hypothetical protein